MFRGPIVGKSCSIVSKPVLSSELLHPQKLINNGIDKSFILKKQ